MVPPPPVPGNPLAAAGTFLLGWLLFGFTAQVAASYLLPDPPWRRALAVGLVPAAVSMALVRFDPLLVVAAGLAADAVAFDRLYDVDRRTLALLVLLHYAVTVAIVLLLANLAALRSTAPA